MATGDKNESVCSGRRGDGQLYRWVARRRRIGSLFPGQLGGTRPGDEQPGTEAPGRLKREGGKGPGGNRLPGDRAGGPHHRAAEVLYTREALENAGPIIGDKTVIMSLQNGLGNEEIIAEVVGKKHLLGGRTFAGGSVIGPGQVIANSTGKPAYIGELDGATTERAIRIAEEFKRAGLLITVSADIIGIMWDKLLVSVATGALCGITRLPHGGLYQMPELRDCALEAVAEGIAVAKAIGVALATKDPEEAWSKASEGLSGGFKPSLLQSLEKGLRTEIDFINGAVVKGGGKCQVPTPVNKTLAASIKGIEYWMEHYGKKALYESDTTKVLFEM